MGRQQINLCGPFAPIQRGPAFNQAATPMRHLILRLRLGRKLALLGAIALVMALAPLVLHVVGVEQGLAATKSELDGLEPSRLLLAVIQRAQQHRGL